MNNTISDHKQLMASLSDEQRIELTQKSDIAGFFHLTNHILAIVLSSTWIVNGWVGWQAVLILHGIMLVFLFTLLHETVHMTVFKTTQMNTFVGWLCALVIILPPNWFRYFHLAHHRHTHNPKKDPELEGNKPETMSEFLWVVGGLPVWWFHITTVFKNAFTNPVYDYVPKAGYDKIKSEAKVMLAIYMALFGFLAFFKLGALIWLWLIPILIGQPFLRLYLMAEHGRCPHVASMLENTRTTYTNRFVRWLAWNMPYHSEHHIYPSVPFYKLPKFHEVTKEHLKITENGYIEFQKKSIQLLAGKGEHA